MDGQVVPTELKSTTPFLQRAAEMRNSDPVIQFYCLYHAAELALALKPQTPSSKTFVLKLLDDLEDLKGTLGENEAVTDEMAGAAYIRNFCDVVFKNADDEDRSGKANKLTAKKFLAAANFLELLGDVGALDDEIRQKIKYAKWKATDIAKAFKEGRKPTPGPPGGLETEEQAAASDPPAFIDRDTTPTSGPISQPEHTLAPPTIPLDNLDAPPPTEVPHSPSYPFPIVPSEQPGGLFASAPLTSPAHEEEPVLPSTPPMPSITKLPMSPPRSPGKRTPSPINISPSAPMLKSKSQFSPFPVTPATAHLNVPSPTAPAQGFAAMQQQPPKAPHRPAHPELAETYDPQTVAQAQKAAKFAISALNYDDYAEARKQLLKALSLIGG